MELFSQQFRVRPRGPQDRKNSISRGDIEKIKLSIRNEIFIENEIFILGPSLAAEKQGLGLKFSIENEIFKPRMKISSENENFVRGGMVFFHAFEREWILSIPGPSGEGMRLVRWVPNARFGPSFWGIFGVPELHADWTGAILFLALLTQSGKSKWGLSHCPRLPRIVVISRREFPSERGNPTVPEGHKHRVTTPEKPRKIPRTSAEPRRAPQNPPSRRDPAEPEPSERQISSESLAEGCAPRMVTIRNFRRQMFTFSVCALLCCKNLCWASRFCTYFKRGGGYDEQIKSNAQSPWCKC